MITKILQLLQKHFWEKAGVILARKLAMELVKIVCFGYSDAIIDATINAILCEFVMSKVSCDEMSNMNMIVETSKLTTNHYATYKNFLSGGSWGFFCGGA